MIYLIQAAHSMACTRKHQVWMPLIVTNRQFRLYRIQRDDELIELVTQKQREFWARVEARDPPPPSTIDDVKLRWPTHQVASKHADEAIAIAIADLKALKAEIKEAEENKKALELCIKTFMGTAAAIVDVSGRPLCTWKQNKSSSIFDVDRFAMDHPAMYRQYLFERPGARPLLTK
jgi:predicted phage-related endonuclease